MFHTAIIIPHHNDINRLGRCLAALMPQVGPGTEVVVVENGSDEDPAPLCATHVGLRLVREPQKGAAHARNRGVAETSAPYILFLDCDCLPAPDWLASASTAQQHGDLVGGRIDVFDETPPPRTGAQAFEAVFAFDNRTYVEKKRFSASANLATRRDVFETTGPFVHGLSEDFDWCRRAVAKGYHLAYDDTLRVSHPSREDWAALVRKWRRLTKESFNVNGRGSWQRMVWGARALLMPFSVLVHAPRVLLHPALRDGGERWRALKMLGRLRLARMAWMLAQVMEPSHHD